MKQDISDNGNPIAIGWCKYNIYSLHFVGFGNREWEIANVELNKA